MLFSDGQLFSDRINRLFLSIPALSVQTVGRLVPVLGLRSYWNLASEADTASKGFTNSGSPDDTNSPFKQSGGLLRDVALMGSNLKHKFQYSTLHECLYKSYWELCACVSRISTVCFHYEWQIKRERMYCHITTIERRSKDFWVQSLRNDRLSSQFDLYPNQNGFGMKQFMVKSKKGMWGEKTTFFPKTWPRMNLERSTEDRIQWFMAR
jgi:hypothetical protein